MAGRVLDLDTVLQVQALANEIGNTWITWNQLRQPQLDLWLEIRNYVFATDTTTTTNSQLPWKNKTTLPKLCQIRDNLHANYMAALFPHDNWLNWIGDDENAVAKDKRVAIESYMENKTRLSKFRATVSKLVYDYIDYGNLFSTTEYINETTTDEVTGDVIPGYVGPRLVRISPNDIVFNPIADSFENTPKIIRTIKTLGELKADLLDHPEQGYLQEAVDLAMANRTKIANIGETERYKDDGFQMDGFGSRIEYLRSNYVELLEFHGDLYDQQEDVLYKNHIITVMDRTHIIRKVQNPRWRVNSGIRHTGWRGRPDNLYSMGPLENLIGMQYRIDHLENLRADVFDLIAHPVLKIKGFVEDFEYGPNERIYIGEDGDVTFMAPDGTVLAADPQIRELEARMEDYVGAPKQAMGIRTPGEKTKFEVQILENASGRIFQNKISHLEDTWMEPTLNDMLEQGRRNIQNSDQIRVMDNDTDVVLFEKITKEDLTAAGKIRPIGARHFARQANMLQNLANLSNSAMGQDPAINVHISGLKMAKLMEGLMEIEKFGLVEENIRVTEQAQTQRIVAASQEQVAQETGNQGAVDRIAGKSPATEATQAEVTQ